MFRKALVSTLALTMGLLINSIAMAQVFEPKEAEIALLPHSAKLGMDVATAFEKRSSIQPNEFHGEGLTLQEVSDLLWFGYGINRPNDKNKRTAPSSGMAYESDVFMIFPAGAYRYEPETHRLVRVSTADLRLEVAGLQKDMATAPNMLVVAAHPEKLKGKTPERQHHIALVAGGTIIQNICLYCAGAGIRCRPRATMDAEALRKSLGLDENAIMVMTHAFCH